MHGFLDVKKEPRSGFMCRVWNGECPNMWCMLTPLGLTGANVARCPDRRRLSSRLEHCGGWWSCSALQSNEPAREWIGRLLFTFHWPGTVVVPSCGTSCTVPLSDHTVALFLSFSRSRPAVRVFAERGLVLNRAAFFAQSLKTPSERDATFRRVFNRNLILPANDHTNITTPAPSSSPPQLRFECVCLTYLDTSTSMTSTEGRETERGERKKAVGERNVGTRQKERRKQGTAQHRTLTTHTHHITSHHTTSYCTFSHHHHSTPLHSTHIHNSTTPFNNVIPNLNGIHVLRVLRVSCRNRTGILHTS